MNGKKYINFIVKKNSGDDSNRIKTIFYKFRLLSFVVRKSKLKNF